MDSDMDDLDDIMMRSSDLLADSDILLGDSDPNSHNKNKEKRGVKRSLSVMQEGNVGDAQSDLALNPQKRRRVDKKTYGRSSSRNSNRSPKHLTRASRAASRAASSSSSALKNMRGKPKPGE